MGEILKARADRVAINITLNSFGTPLNEVRSCIYWATLLSVSMNIVSAHEHTGLGATVACDAHLGPQAAVPVDWRAVP